MDCTYILKNIIIITISNIIISYIYKYTICIDTI